MEQSSRKKPLLIGAVIVIVLLVVGVASYFFLSGPRAPQTTQDPNRVANLSFQFDQIDAIPGEQIDLDIYLESDISVTQATVSFVYDPEAIVMEAFQPTVDNFMGTPREYEIIENTIDEEEGLAIFRLQTFDTQEPPSTTRQGKGVITRVRFSVQPTFSGTTPIIIFKDEDVPNLTSEVYRENYNNSILNNAGSILINVE